jgi:hypothetical protein
MFRSSWIIIRHSDVDLKQRFNIWSFMTNIVNYVTQRDVEIGNEIYNYYMMMIQLDRNMQQI